MYTVRQLRPRNRKNYQLPPSLSTPPGSSDSIFEDTTVVEEPQRNMSPQSSSDAGPGAESVTEVESFVTYIASFEAS